jgi:hypothetical protein
MAVQRGRRRSASETLYGNLRGDFHAAGLPLVGAHIFQRSAKFRRHASQSIEERLGSSTSLGESPPGDGVGDDSREPRLRLPRPPVIGVRGLQR